VPWASSRPSFFRCAFFFPLSLPSSPSFPLCEAFCRALLPRHDFEQASPDGYLLHLTSSGSFPRTSLVSLRELGDGSLANFLHAIDNADFTFPKAIFFFFSRFFFERPFEHTSVIWRFFLDSSERRHRAAQSVLFFFPSRSAPSTLPSRLLTATQFCLFPPLPCLFFLSFSLVQIDPPLFPFYSFDRCLPGRLVGNVFSDLALRPPLTLAATFFCVAFLADADCNVPSLVLTARDAYHTPFLSYHDQPSLPATALPKPYRRNWAPLTFFTPGSVLSPPSHL